MEQVPYIQSTKIQHTSKVKKVKGIASLSSSIERLALVDSALSLPTTAQTKTRNVKVAASLRCAVAGCSAYVYSPVLACAVKGHGALCISCAARRAGRCPLCAPRLLDDAAGGPAASVHSTPLFREIDFDLEQLAETQLLWCFYRHKGCHYRFPPKEIAGHQVECRYSLKHCFSNKCDFLGDNKELAAHMEMVHPERVSKDNEVEFTIRDFRTRTTDVQHLQYLSCIYGDFWIKWEYDAQSMLYGAVQYIGPKQEAEKLEYQIEMKEYDGNKFTGLKAVHTANMPTYTQKFDELFDKQECFTVSSDFAQYFERNDNLYLTVRVKEANNI